MDKAIATTNALQQNALGGLFQKTDVVQRHDSATPEEKPNKVVGQKGCSTIDQPEAQPAVQPEDQPEDQPAEQPAEQPEEQPAEQPEDQADEPPHTAHKPTAEP